MGVAGPFIKPQQAYGAIMSAPGAPKDTTWGYNMTLIASAESSFGTHSTNHNGNGTTDFGVWQINSVNGGGSKDFDVATCAADAVKVWHSQGYHAWTVWNSGAAQMQRGKVGAIDRSNTSFSGSSSGLISEEAALAGFTPADPKDPNAPRPFPPKGPGGYVLYAKDSNGDNHTPWRYDAKDFKSTGSKPTQVPGTPVTTGGSGATFNKVWGATGKHGKWKLLANGDPSLALGVVNPLGGITADITAIAKGIAFLSDAHNWYRMGIFLAGLALIGLGLIFLMQKTDTGKQMIKGAKKAASAAMTAAVIVPK